MKQLIHEMACEINELPLGNNDILEARLVLNKMRKLVGIPEVDYVNFN